MGPRKHKCVCRSRPRSPALLSTARRIATPPASLLPLRYIIEALNLNLDAAMQQPDFKDTLCQEQEGLNHNFDVNELATVGVGVHPTGPRRAALDDHP